MGNLNSRLDRFYNQMKKADLERIVIGELTTADGPFLDDHFLVVIDSELNLKEFSTGVECFSQIIRKIEDLFEIKIEFGLCNKTDFQSRVIYPDELKGEKIFVFEKFSRSDVSFLKILTKETLQMVLNPRLLIHLKRPNHGSLSEY